MVLAVVVVTALTVASLAADDQHPNIVFLIVDDQDFASLGAYADYAYTPRLDQLAAEGMLFHRAYVTSSACSPSRYAMFTGRVATRGSGDAFHEFHAEGQPGYITNDVVQLELDRPNFVQQLHENGYFTGFIGKWHLGPHRIADLGGRRIPRGQQLGEPHVDAILQENHRLYAEYIRQFGFDFADRIYWDNIGNWDTHVDGLDAQNLEWKVEGALDFLDQAAQQDNPFLLWFAMVQPHNPSAAVADFPPLPGSERITPIGLLPEDAIPNVMPARDTIEERIRAAGKPPRPPRRETAQKYGNEYSLWIDDGVGAILDRLEQMGVADNTIVIYMSDNATWGKFHTYELGNNVPQIIRWPGKIEAGSVNNHLFSNVDFAPTLLAAAGVDLPGDLGQDGVNQLPSLMQNESVRDVVFLEFGTTRSVSDGVWKYIAIRPTEEDFAFGEKLGIPIGHWGERELERRFIGLLLAGGLFAYPAISSREATLVRSQPTDPREVVVTASDAIGVAGPHWVLTEGIEFWRAPAGPQWIEVDFRYPVVVDSVTLEWREQCAADYRIELSMDGEVFEKVVQVRDLAIPDRPRRFVNKPGELIHEVSPSREARYLRVVLERAAVPDFGYGLMLIRINGENLTSFAPVPEDAAYRNTLLTLGERVDDLLAHMTFLEKMKMSSGFDAFFFPGLPRFGFRSILLNDSTSGIVIRCVRINLASLSE